MTRSRWIIVCLLILLIGGAIILRQRRASQEEQESDTGFTAPVVSAAAASEVVGETAAASAGDIRPNSGENLPERESSWEEVLVEANGVLSSMQANIKDYQATLLSRERVQGDLQKESRMQIKVRNASANDGHGLSAYLKFESTHNKGREIIWSEDRQDGKFLVHEAGFMRALGTMALKPEGTLAMNGQKYPITEIGLIRLAEKIIEKAESQKSNRQAQVKILEDQMVGDRKCRLYQVVNPQKNEVSDFHIAQVYVDIERQVPLRYAAYMWPVDGGAPPLEEEYTYLNLRLNTGLDASAFDSENPEYDFP